MPRTLKRYYGLGDLHFVTFSRYRRLPLLGSARRRDLFLRLLEKVRIRYELVVVGYVAMPEHVHLLLSEPQRQNLSVAIKALKQATARRMLGSSRRRHRQQTELFSRDSMPARFWQARFYDFNVWSAKKRVEKLRYIHRNPVTRGLVPSPEQWRWSSFRSYAHGEPGLVGSMPPFHPNACGKGPQREVQCLPGLFPDEQKTLVWGTPPVGVDISAG